MDQVQVFKAYASIGDYALLKAETAKLWESVVKDKDGHNHQSILTHIEKVIRNNDVLTDEERFFIKQSFLLLCKKEITDEEVSTSRTKVVVDLKVNPFAFLGEMSDEELTEFSEADDEAI